MSRLHLLSACSSILSLWLAGPACGQEIPAPEEFLGHAVGAENRLARWDKIVEYMQTAARGSDRVLCREIGKSTQGNPFILVVVSSPDNLQKLDYYKSVNRRLSDPRTIASEAEEARLLREGRMFVLVTCSIHATEIGASQMALEAVHRLATERSPGIGSILDNVIFLLAPSLNPDGQILVTDWYNKTVGTPYEDSPLPWLYHPYVGHDNNRDAYMFTQQETRLMGRVLYHDWFPSVWLDMHQMGPSGPRAFVMPASDPINPNVNPLLYRYAGLLGFAQAAALEKAGKRGIITGTTYSYWWEGAMAWAGWWHNMVGMLMEVASARVASKVEQKPVDPNRMAPPGPPKERRRALGSGADGPLDAPTDVQPRVSYPQPWLGGPWSLRDIVEYQLIATFALLETSANLRAQLLAGLLAVRKREIELGRKGDPFAVVVPWDQQDRPTVVKLLETLSLGGVEVHRASRSFTADGRAYAAGTYVILLSQPFRAYAKDLLEAQIYPRISPTPGAPPIPPYDIAGWSLGLQMGVETVFINKPFEADLQRLDSVELPAGRVSGIGDAYLISHESNNSLAAVNRLLKAGQEIYWLKEELSLGGRKYAPGAILVRGGGSLPSAMKDLAGTLGIDAVACRVPAAESIRIRAPRTALYRPWGGNIDEGWTRWLLEQSEFPFASARPEDVRNGDLLQRLDAFIFPDMTAPQILDGLTGENVPPEYRGGIEESGVRALRAFVERGGSVIALGQSSALLIDKFSAPFSDPLRDLKREEFYCPGSVLRVQVDASHPLAYGMREEAHAYFSNSMVLEPVPSFSTMSASIVVRYPNANILRSGFLQGESHLYNRVAVAEVRLGKGRLVLMPLRVQHRAQSHGTFKLLFNAILTSAS